MKKWSRAIVIGMCVCVIGTAALAESKGVDAVSSAVQDTQDTQNQQMPPAMPGQQNQDGQDRQMPPPMPGQQNQDGQERQMPPPMPGQQNQDGQDRQMPPAMPGQQNQDGQNQQMPPAMSGQQNQDGQNQQMSPPMSGQQNQDGQNQQMPSGMPDMKGGRPEKPGEMNGMPGMRGGMGGPGGESAPSDYNAANTVTESSTGASYVSSNDSENAVLVSQGNVTLSGSTVSKTGSSSSESADFYGINAAVLARNGSTLTIENAEITSDGGHANGVFSYGSGTTVNVSDTSITTSGNNSGGLMTTGGAAMNADNVTVSTSGNSSAAIRSDRGGGTVTVTGGRYDTTGVGSPAIYSTADITVSDADLSAATSEAVVIEGGNSVTLRNVTITGSNTQLNGQSTVNTNVLIYQSMSGDASEGASSFTMTDGSMTAETGAMFHVTNVTTTINLENVDFTYASDSNVFLDASADAWGRTGENGGNVTLNLKSQDITGAILSDSLSSVTLNLDAGSTWTLTGDSYVTAFNGDLNNVNLNGYTLYVDGVAVSK